MRFKFGKGEMGPESSAVKYLLTLFISMFFFALTFTSAPGVLTPRDRIFIVCLLVSVIGVQIVIATGSPAHATTSYVIDHSN